MTLSTCRYVWRFRVIEFGWHLLQIPRGHGGWSLQPVFIRQLMSSNCMNLPLQNANKCEMQQIYYLVVFSIILFCLHVFHRIPINSGSEFPEIRMKRQMLDILLL